MKYVQSHIWKEHLCALQVSYVHLSCNLWAHAHTKLRGNIASKITMPSYYLCNHA